MFHKVGDFIRMGSKMTDPYHSLVVTPPDGQVRDTLISMNRGHARKLHIHVWRVIGAEFDENPVVEPIHSEPFSPLWDTYNAAEKLVGGF